VTTRVSLSSAGSPLTLRLTLRNADGTTVAGNPVEIRLPQNGHATRAIEQLFPSVAATFEGTLTVIADGGAVAATVVEVDKASLTPLPVVPLP
jgi:hypothetical protein